MHTDHACPQKPNRSSETVPLRTESACFIMDRSYYKCSMHRLCLCVFCKDGRTWCVSILYYFCLVLTYPFLRPGGPGPHSVESIQPEGRETVSASTGHMHILVVTVKVFFHFVVRAKYLTYLGINASCSLINSVYLVLCCCICIRNSTDSPCIVNVVLNHFFKLSVS